MSDMHKDCLRIRYIGQDHARMFTIQRGDFKYWDGSGWSRILDKAKVFHDHKTAAEAVTALQYQQYKGKPIRAFKLELSIVLAADDVENISQEALANYIIAALRLDVDNGVFGDGPVQGSFVQARLKMATLEETVPRRKRF